MGISGAKSVSKIKNTYSIEEVSEIAGVNSFTLRNWEDRYALFTPTRDSNDHRIYSESDAMRAVAASELVKRSYKISKVANELVGSADPSNVLARCLESDLWKDLRQKSFEGLLQFDPGPFRMAFDHLISNFSMEFLADHFFYPLFRKIEELILKGQITEFQSMYVHHHLASRIHRLIGMLELNHPVKRQSRVMLTGFPENMYEDSLLILYLILERTSWQVFYGGKSNPLHELPATIESTQADILVLVGNNLSVEQYDAHEPKLIGLKIPIIVGGKLALKLRETGREPPQNIEWCKLRPGPLAKIMTYKLF